MMLVLPVWSVLFSTTSDNDGLFFLSGVFCLVSCIVEAPAACWRILSSIPYKLVFTFDRQSSEE